MPENDSILTSTKLALGLGEAESPFDAEILMHINSALGTVTQLGIGPEEGFRITGVDETWTQLIGTELRYNPVKDYIYIRTRLMFDPPSVGYVLTAFERQKEELEARLKWQRDDIDYPQPVPASPELVDMIDDPMSMSFVEELP